MNKHDILIVGGTGRIGSELVSLLLDAGIHFRMLVRQQSTALLPQSEYCEITHGDLSKPVGLEVALRDIKQVFLLTHDQACQAKREGRFIELAKQAGVEKIVKSSAFAASLQPPVGYGINHAESEQNLMASGLQWVLLRPYMFMQNFLEISGLIKSQNLLPLPLGKAKVALIDARDVALVALTVLGEEGHEKRCYELTGPDAPNMDDCADILSDLLDRSIRYRSPPFWLAGLMMRMQGVSAWDVEMRKQLFRMIAQGGEAEVNNNVEDITGHKPRSFQTFAHEHQVSFQ